MAKRKTRGGSSAATVIKVTLLILLVIIILAAAVFGAYYLSNGFGGRYATFAVQINGELVLSSGSIELPRGSTVKITSLNDYTLEVYASEPERDFDLTVDGEVVKYSEYVGEGITSGFTFSEDNGVFTIEYGNLDDIISAAFGEQILVSDYSGGELFTLVITSGKSTLYLNFGMSSFSSEFDIVFDVNHIIFYDIENQPENLLQ